MLTLFLSLNALLCLSHISMQFPEPRDSLNGRAYAKWEQNEPMIGVHPTICHALDVDTSVRANNVFAAGDTITIELYGTAVHDGGHCAFWISTDDETFTKIVDIKDCTIAAANTVQVTLRNHLPTACGTKCTFAWTWVPRVSQLCEIYMNCADIQITGTVGGETSPLSINFQSSYIDKGVNNDYGCIRVDDNTHWTTIFGEIRTNGSTEYNTPVASPTNNPVKANQPTNDPVMKPTNNPVDSSNSGCDTVYVDVQTCNEWYCGFYVRENTCSSSGSNYNIQKVEIRSYYSGDNNWYEASDATSGVSGFYQHNVPSSAMSYPLDLRITDSNGVISILSNVISQNSNDIQCYTGDVGSCNNNVVTDDPTESPEKTPVTSPTDSPVEVAQPVAQPVSSPVSSPPTMTPVARSTPGDLYLQLNRGSGEWYVSFEIREGSCASADSSNDANAQNIISSVLIKSENPDDNNNWHEMNENFWGTYTTRALSVKLSYPLSVTINFDDNSVITANYIIRSSDEECYDIGDTGNYGSAKVSSGSSSGSSNAVVISVTAIVTVVIVLIIVGIVFLICRRRENKLVRVTTEAPRNVEMEIGLNDGVRPDTQSSGKQGENRLDNIVAVEDDE